MWCCSKASTAGPIWAGRPVLKAGKPVFIDKPIAGSLADALAIFALAKEAQHAVFFQLVAAVQRRIAVPAKNDPKLGKVLGCDAYSPASWKPHHPDLFWYGVHGVESLFTFMGTGCKSVRARTPKDTDVVTGAWDDGRVGTFRGLRARHAGLRRTVFGTKGIAPTAVRRLSNRSSSRSPSSSAPASPRQRRGNDRNLRLHGSRRRKQTARRRAGDASKA